MRVPRSQSPSLGVLWERTPAVASAEITRSGGDRQAHHIWEPLNAQRDRGDSGRLRSYTISKGPELTDPLDPDSSPTGNTIFVLDEFYESPAGPVEHWRLARSSDLSESWPEDLHALIP